LELLQCIFFSKYRLRRRFSKYRFLAGLC